MQQTAISLIFAADRLSKNDIAQITQASIFATDTNITVSSGSTQIIVSIGTHIAIFLYEILDLLQNELSWFLTQD